MKKFRWALRRKLELSESVVSSPLKVKKTKKSKSSIYIIADRCKGCGYCIKYCPEKVLAQSHQMNAMGIYPPQIVEETKCVFCCFCSAICPDFAIFIVQKQ